MYYLDSVHIVLHLKMIGKSTLDIHNVFIIYHLKVTHHTYSQINKGI